ncbi:hypothetical protein DICSQDRAFT_72267 [Dichomitus squalens LYAD-421 SS1]|uniref:Carboxymuconolactone decarboxylase-like domain-containing protein n=1 Tax=Dichomitus squalens (strain LYAD-421) TaxID=732165 RepID=R7SIP7_DICSQ|nr:uncharacterized protein DICSQDRAFT_72267 [Dichomitus squalens LYAD-421 SS1]EJF56041.1 hypothetical protein DICSQDRAFT_72267 [Dichomitus squalens LYAD-421 SS1]
MPAVPYLPQDISSSLANDIRARRGAGGLLPLDRILLHAPPIAEGWSKLLGAVRTGSILEDDLRKIIILRVAARNGASFIWIHHEQLARAAGVSTEQLTRIGDIETPLPELSHLTSSGPGLFSVPQAAVLQLAEDMTTKVHLGRDGILPTLTAFQQSPLRDPDNLHRKVVEAVSTCAAYNMTSRFVVALDVDDRANIPCPVPGLTAQPVSSHPGLPSGVLASTSVNDLYFGEQAEE